MQRLTQSEEDALHVLWQAGGGFVKDVLERLPEPRPPYTTLAATIRNLERKGYVRANKLGSAYRFTPLVTALDYQRHSLGTLVSQHFRNSYKELVSSLAEERKISAQELREVIALLEQPPPA